MKKTTTITLCAIIALVAAAALLGPKRFFSHVMATKTQVQGYVQKNASDDHEVARVAVLLRQLGEDIHLEIDKIADIEDRLVEERQTVGRLARKKEAMEKILKCAESLLSSDRDNFMIAGKNYSRTQVERDALLHLKKTERLENDLISRRELASALESMLGKGQAAIDNLKRERNATSSNFEILKARLTNARLQEEVAALAHPRADALASRSELTETLKQLERRTRQVERRVSESLASDGEIEWNEPQEVDVLSELRKSLNLSGETRANPETKDWGYDYDRFEEDPDSSQDAGM